MRSKLILFTLFSVLTTVTFAQDINRASEWHTKRPEQSQAQVASEMVYNGTSLPVGEDPSVLDEFGNPTSRRIRQSTARRKGNGAATVRHGSDRLTQGQFDVAQSVVGADDERQGSSFAMGVIFLLIGLAVAGGFRIMTNRIKVPAHL